MIHSMEIRFLEDCSGQPHTPVKPKRKKGRPKGTPPKKAPNFITPPTKSLFRKRKATSDSWKKNIRKNSDFQERSTFQ